MSLITRTCFFAFMFVSTFISPYRKFIKSCNATFVRPDTAYLRVLENQNGTCLKVTFERAYVSYINPKYVEYAFSNVTRYGRRSDYYINVEFISRYTLNNNVTINILFYELRRNEYRRSFVELHYGICDFLDKDPYIGGVAVGAGVKCPIKARTKYTLKNLTINLDSFPNLFPFEKGRINFCFNRTSDWEPIAEGVLHLSFFNDAKGKKEG